MPSESVRITCSTEDLDAKLSKSMKTLGAHHDQYGRLVNAEGKFIAGLSQQRIKMGDWIDSLGRARDAQGGFLDGLSATELKLRYYKDELGNVYDAEGNLVRVSEELARVQREELAAAEAEAARQAAEAAKEQENLAKAAEQGKNKIWEGAEGVANMANNLSLMIGVLGGGNESLNKFGQGVVIAAQSFSQFALAMKTLPKFVEGFKALRAATQGQTAAQVVLNAVSGNWITLVAGGLAAGTLAYKTLSASTKEAGGATATLTDEYERLTQTLKKYRLELTATNAEQVGFLNPDHFETSGVDEAIHKLRVLQKAREILTKEFNDAVSAGSYGESDTIQEAIDINKSKEAEQQKIIASRVNELVNKDLPAKTELEKLQERAAYYTQMIDKGSLEGEALATAQTALANNLSKQKEIVDKQNQEKERAAKEEADRKAAEAAKKLADAQNKLGDKFEQYASGYALYDAEQKAAADLQTTIETWRENFAAAGKSQAELDAAVANLTKEYNDKRLQEFLDKNNLKIKETQKLTAEEEYTNTLNAIKEAEQQYGLQAAEAEKLRAQAAEDYAAELKKQEEDVAKERESRLNELGITGLREQMKSPLEKMLEQQQKVQQAQAEGLISAAESNQMQAKLASDYWQQNLQAEPGGDSPVEKAEEYRHASSMTAGSNALYQAMTQREDATERYQNDVKKNLGNMARYAEDNYDALQTIQANLANVMKAVGVV